jgi:hypothetical protein
MQLSPGRWDPSLQYRSPRDLELSGQGVTGAARASLDRLGPLWPVGSAVVPRAGDTVRAIHVTVSMSPEALPLLRRRVACSAAWLRSLHASARNDCATRRVRKLRRLVDNRPLTGDPLVSPPYRSALAARDASRKSDGEAGLCGSRKYAARNGAIARSGSLSCVRR